MSTGVEKFARLDLCDEGARTGAAHMALDEAILRCAAGPVLRWYRWEREEVSFGYPLRWSDVARVAAGRPCVRRWTGGGIVEHGADVTIAIAVPAGDPAARMTPAAFYERAHEAVARSLGPAVRLATAEDSRTGAACFENPARFDVLDGHTKIAGGAIRRTREGLLYQGSIQRTAVPGDFIARLARSLAHESAAWQPDGRTLDLAERLRATRYATREWLVKR